MKIHWLSLALSLCLVTACRDNPNPPTDGGVEIERGPKQLAVDGDPNGLWWDAASQTLYLADDQNNRILTWTDAEGFAVYGNLPATATSPGLGQLVRLSDGTVVVTRFGGGTAGDVAYLKPDHTGVVVPNLPATRSRIGLTVGPDGTLYDTYFVRVGNTKVGSVAKLTLDGTETEIVGALQKPVGVAVIGDQLYISDQELNKLFRSSLGNPSATATFSTISKPDLLGNGPNGSFFTGSKDGIVYKIDSAGAVSVFASGYQQPHGTAYDAENKRLFIADHDGNPDNGTTHFLQIIPVEE